jgi:hypothetical protein
VFIAQFDLLCKKYDMEQAVRFCSVGSFNVQCDKKSDVLLSRFDMLVEKCGRDQTVQWFLCNAFVDRIVNDAFVEFLLAERDVKHVLWIFCAQQSFCQEIFHPKTKEDPLLCIPFLRHIATLGLVDEVRRLCRRATNQRCRFALFTSKERERFSIINDREVFLKDAISLLQDDE